MLPLTNMTSNSEDEYFADGMTEELISTLSQMRALKVISRTSIMRFKKTDKSTTMIGSELNAGTVLEGSVRKSGTRLRITVQLIDVQSDVHLWSENYDRELKDVFEVQSDVAKSIANALKVHLLEEDKERIDEKKTDSIEAYTLYLKGRRYLNQRMPKSIDKAIEYFELAIESDHNYARAYAGLADCYLVKYIHGGTKQDLEKCKEFAIKAVELDEKIAEAHAALGQAFHISNDKANAEKELKLAIELNPNLVDARLAYGGFFSDHGDYLDMFEQALKAMELDPLSPRANTFLGNAYYCQKQWDKALRQLKRGIELDPQMTYPYLRLALVYSKIGMFSEAISAAEKSVDDSVFRPILAYVLAKAGRKNEAQSILEEIRSSEKPTRDEDLPAAYLALGMKEETYACLERAYQLERLTVGDLLRPELEEIAKEERFQKLIEKVRIRMR